MSHRTVLSGGEADLSCTAENSVSLSRRLPPEVGHEEAAMRSFAGCAPSLREDNRMDAMSVELHCRFLSLNGIVAVVVTLTKAWKSQSDKLWGEGDELSLDKPTLRGWEVIPVAGGPGVGYGQNPRGRLSGQKPIGRCQDARLWWGPSARKSRSELQATKTHS